MTVFGLAECPAELNLWKEGGHRKGHVAGKSRRTLSVFACKWYIEREIEPDMNFDQTLLRRGTIGSALVQ